MIGVRRLLALVCCAAAVLSLTCGSDEGPGPEPVRLTINPGDMTVSASSAQDFTADVGGQRVYDVGWYVDGIRGGNAAAGMISATGSYVAPGEVPSGGYVTLSARAVVNQTSYRDSVRITIIKPSGTPTIVVSPDTVSVIDLGVVGFSGSVSNCASSEVTWSLARLWGSTDDLGTISPGGVYEAPTGIANSFAVMVKATGVDCPTKVGIAKVVFYPSEWPDIQLESFTESLDAPGSAPIQAATCGGAVGGLAVQGLDTGGEWIKVPIYIPLAGVYRAFVRFQSMPGDTIAVRVAMEGCGTPVPESDFILTGGYGLG